MPASIAEDRRSSVVAGLFVFVLAVTIRLWFNFVFRHPDASLSCDAWEYFSTASAVASMANGQIHQAIAPTGELFSKLLAEGPVFPIFLVACQAILHTSGSTAIVAVQSIVSALTCVLLFMIGKSLWSRPVGVVSGIIAAVYPAFIINSGRVLPETLACFLISLCALLLVWQRHGRLVLWSILVAGAASAMLMYSRSALLLVAILNTIYSVLMSVRYRNWKICILFVVGLIAVVFPWMSFQSTGTGSLKPFVDRASHLNCAVGNNVAAEGWSIAPYPNYGGIETESLTKIVARSFKSDPFGWVELTASKVARLTKFPWNDFRVSIGIVKFRAQVVFHQLLILFAAIGCILAVPPIKRGAPSSANLFGRLLIVAIVCLHFAYLGFVGLPRYFFTAMPLVVLLASASLVFIAECMSTQSRPVTKVIISCSCLWFIARANVAGGIISFVPVNILPANIALPLIVIVSIAVKFVFLLYALSALSKLVYAAKVEKIMAGMFAFLLLAVSFPSLCCPLKAHGRWYEKRLKVARGKGQEEVIAIPTGAYNSKNDRKWFVLVDADGWKQLRDLKIAIDGIAVDESVIPGLSLADLSNKYDQVGDGLQKPYEQIYSSLANPAGKSLIDLRQWFWIPVKSDLITRKSVVSLVDETGDFELFQTFRSDKMPSLFTSSWDKAFYGVDWERGLSDTRLDDSTRQWASVETMQADLSKVGKRLQVRLVAVPFVNGKNDASEWRQLQSLKNVMVVPDRARDELKEIEPLKGSTDWLVRVKGTVESQREALEECGVQISFVNSDNKLVYCAWAPSKIPMNSHHHDETQKCEFNLAFPLSNFDKDISKIQLHLDAQKRHTIFKRPDRVTEANFSNITIDAEPLPKLEWAKSVVF